MNGMSLHQVPPTAYHEESYFPYHPPPPPPPPPSSSAVNLVAPLPTVSILENALPSVQSPTTQDANRVAWIRDVLLVVKLANAAAEGLSHSDSKLPLEVDFLSPKRIVGENFALEQLVQAALDMLICMMPSLPSKDVVLSPALAEALYIRATLTASGAFPEYVPKSLKTAFREFEMAGRAGYLPAWFKLARDYESFGNVALARQCFERGSTDGDSACTFRLGIAKLLGHLDFTVDFVEATRLLRQAATTATIECPHPAYVYALLLRDEAVQVSLPNNVIAPFLPPQSNRLFESRKHLERAAYLHWTPALTRIGRAYEFSDEPFEFNPVLSIDYYNLASGEGDAQADLALSKWFLCGAERFFPKDENRARECAKQGAIRGLPAAKFAMGYYCEVGIGGPKNADEARSWYKEAAAGGNAEAESRLTVLASSDANTLSRAEHETIAEDNLVRTRTLARIRSHRGRRPVSPSGPPRPVSNPRQESMQIASTRQQSLPSEVQTSVSYDNDPYIGQRPRPGYTTAMRSHSNDTFSIPLHLNPQEHAPHQPYVYGPHIHPPHQSQSQPQPQPQLQQFQDRPRYTLVDPGVSPSSSTRGLPNVDSPRNSPRMSHRQLSSNTGHHPRQNSLGANPPANEFQQPKTKYSTFAEMGIEGKKLEEKECVIM